MLWSGLMMTTMMMGPPRPGLVLTADPCLELDAVELRGAFDHHLGAGIDHRGAAAAQARDTQLVLDCSGPRAPEEMGVVLTILDPLTATSTTRTLELPAPERRAEQLGWAAAAALRATWSVLEREPAGTDELAPRRRRAARIARRVPSEWMIGDGFVARGFFDSRSPQLMLGEQVAIMHRPFRHLAWKADGELAYFPVLVHSEGLSDRVNTLSVSIAPSLQWWGEFPSALPRGRGTVAIYGGAGLRTGGVRMRSSEFGNSGGFQAFVGPLVNARISVSFGRYVRLALEGEAGWLLHGPDRPGGVPLSYLGPWANGVLVLVSAF